jgi:hypothetical protein
MQIMKEVGYSNFTLIQNRRTSNIKKSKNCIMKVLVKHLSPYFTTTKQRIRH